MDAVFFLNSIGLGLGLAMDAFSVSVANGLAEPNMKKRKSAWIAFVYAFFQFLMPLLGWTLVHTLVRFFSSAEKAIPWIALFLLLFLGGKMIFECLKNNELGETDEGANESEKHSALTLPLVLLQGIATSIDALSVGFTVQSYSFWMATVSSLVIGSITFVLCALGLLLGKKVGGKLRYAELFGGVILIAIGLEIFLAGIL